MLVKEVMTASRVVLKEDMPVQQAAQAFVAHSVLGAPVVGGDGELKGIVTEIDLLRDRFEPDPRAHEAPVAEPENPPPPRVADVMTRTVVATTELADVAELADRMLRSRIRCVPVLREGRVVGMVSRGDLLRLQARPDGHVRADVLRALAEKGPYLPELRVGVHGGIAHLAGESTEPQRRLAASIARTVPGVSRIVFDGA